MKDGWYRDHDAIDQWSYFFGSGEPLSLMFGGDCFALLLTRVNDADELNVRHARKDSSVMLP